ncbi:hypothetical protein PABG_11920 [Paracoccidioides brasiliensis Pb03]|nr:hypothetical protein PABG_11920 [Paracoccidioides brasiliensis Pb03]
MPLVGSMDRSMGPSTYFMYCHIYPTPCYTHPTISVYSLPFSRRKRGHQLFGRTSKEPPVILPLESWLAVAPTQLQTYQLTALASLGPSQYAMPGRRNPESLASFGLPRTLSEMR